MGTDVLQNLVNQLSILWSLKELRVINGWTPYKVFYLYIRAEIFTSPSIMYSSSFDTGDVGKHPGARKSQQSVEKGRGSQAAAINAIKAINA